ncbi:amidase family protein [Mesorhizobium sp. BH1-1-5]|uniref:amidase family protein n=1 Tax=Mesorhizobium sp. BH1-1-5 TaxID=2876661 RepID=UPI00398F828E
MIRTLEDAAEAESSILGGGWLGPLNGIPVGIKDLIDVAGLPTTAQPNTGATASPGKMPVSLKPCGALAQSSSENRRQPNTR